AVEARMRGNVKLLSRRQRRHRLAPDGSLELPCRAVVRNEDDPREQPFAVARDGESNDGAPEGVEIGDANQPRPARRNHRSSGGRAGLGTSVLAGPPSIGRPAPPETAP